MDAVVIESLSKSFNGKTALDGVDLKVGKGELFAYLGPNGAGKTTTIRILTGMTRFSDGRCTLNGYNIKTQDQLAKAQYGLVSQAINLDQELTVKENLFVHGLLFRMSPSAIKKRTRALLEYTDMADRLNTPVKALSGGMKRRVMIARALFHNPAILFLDEPTVGLDAAIRRRIWALIKKIQSQGTTIFLTTHYIEEAEFLADRVAFLDQGKIVTLDTPARLMAGIGNWAVDRLCDSGMETTYFKDQDQARAFNQEGAREITLRRVNLEDAFLALTGKRVKPGQAVAAHGHGSGHGSGHGHGSSHGPGHGSSQGSGHGHGSSHGHGKGEK